MGIATQTQAAYTLGMTYPKFLASSQDPTQISLTIESAGKVLIGFMGWIAVSKGMDAATAQTQLQVIIDLIAQAVPLCYTLWHTLQLVWGAVRKLLALFKKDPSQNLQSN